MSRVAQAILAFLSECLTFPGPKTFIITDPMYPKAAKNRLSIGEQTLNVPLEIQYIERIQVGKQPSPFSDYGLQLPEWSSLICAVTSALSELSAPLISMTSTGIEPRDF